jgi:hypothetical protein
MRLNSRQSAGEPITLNSCMSLKIPIAYPSQFIQWAFAVACRCNQAITLRTWSMSEMAILHQPAGAILGKLRTCYAFH